MNVGCSTLSDVKVMIGAICGIFKDQVKAASDNMVRMEMSLVPILLTVAVLTQLAAHVQKTCRTLPSVIRQSSDKEYECAGFRAFKPPFLFGSFAMGKLPKPLSSLNSIHTSDSVNILQMAYESEEFQANTFSSRI
jgi:hypothetical protein